MKNKYYKKYFKKLQDEQKLWKEMFEKVLATKKALTKQMRKKK